MNTEQGGDVAGGSVVLMRGRDAGCDVLLRALSARGLSPQTVDDEPGAMLALAGLSHKGLARRVLIVVEPAQWSRLAELLAAVGDYHNSAYCWQFDARDGAGPMLSQLETVSYQFEQGPQVSGAGPVGQIRKRTRPVDRLLVAAPERELSTREVVTQQELTMLLGPAPGEAG